MKYNIIFAMLILVGCRLYKQDLETNCTEILVRNNPYTKEDKLVSLFEELLETGIPGVGAVVYSDEGWWQYSSGLAKIETKEKMKPCHLHYLQSIAKTYQAVAILKLYEKGKLELDHPINQYLPEKYVKMIPRSNEITVRMLLNHTSGLPEYNSHPINITQLLQNPEKFFSTEEYFKVIDGKPLDFEPGSKYSYRNLNYELLSLIADQLTGNHAKHITALIFQPLGLSNSYYRNEDGYLAYPQIYNSYWDRHSDGILENVSQMQQTNVSSMIGDDGIVATPKDAVMFLKGLMEGKILKLESVELMKAGFELSNGKIEYGLGLDHADFGGKKAFGHSGGGLGAGCQLYFIPDNNTYFFIGINMGSITESPITDAAAPILKEIHQVLAK